MKFRKKRQLGHIEIHRPKTQSTITSLIFGENRRPSLPRQMAKFEYTIEGGLKSQTSSISPKRIIIATALVGALPMAWWLNISNASYHLPVFEESTLTSSIPAVKPSEIESAVLPELTSSPVTLSDLVAETEEKEESDVEISTQKMPVSKLAKALESSPEKVFESSIDSTIAHSPFSSWLHLKISSGDTLSTIFDRHGLKKTTLHEILNIDKKHANLLRKLQLDQALHIERDEEGNVIDFTLALNFSETLHIYKENGKFVSKIEKKNIETKTMLASRRIESSLFVDGHEAGLSDRLIANLGDIFRSDVNVRNIKTGDEFSVVYEKQIVQEKQIDGDILGAEFVHRGKTHRAVRYTNKSGETYYYTPDGKNLQKPFLKTPVETTKTVYVDTPVHSTKTVYIEEYPEAESVGFTPSSNLIIPVKYTRLSSSFGERRGRRGKIHKGVDYAAPSGTPIVAAANATVSFVGRRSGYGKMVILQHDKRHETVYAHMSAYIKGLKSGQRVKQGEVIGYVGTTGRATGSHLHYEFRIDGVKKNPVTAKLPSSGKTIISVAKVTTPKKVKKTVKTTKMVKTEKTIKATEYVKTENVVADKKDFIKKTQPILAQLEKARHLAESEKHESKLAQAVSIR